MKQTVAGASSYAESPAMKRSFHPDFYSSSIAQNGGFTNSSFCGLQDAFPLRHRLLIILGSRFLILELDDSLFVRPL